jgi:phosphatidylserine/phosphatidylglycerophosphate/cardiolipin synthase-like enzyme
VDFVRPARPVAVQFVSGRGHYETVIRAVQGARTSVWISTANLKELMIEDTRWSVRRQKRRGTDAYRSIIEVFDDLVTAGVEIRLLHAAPGSRPFREELARHARLVPASKVRKARAAPHTPRAVAPTSMIGLAKPAAPRASGVFSVIAPSAARRASGRFEMRLCPRVHMKAIVVDGGFLYLGSANWTGAGLGAKGSGRRNFELGFVTDDALLLDDVQEIYDRIWRGAECKECKLRDECPAPLDGEGRRARGISMGAQKAVRKRLAIVGA